MLRILLILYCCLFYSQALFAYTTNEKLHTVTYFDYPYVYKSENHLYGKSIEIMKCILAQLNIPYKISVTNLIEAEMAFKNNKSDIFFIINQSVDLNKFGNYSTPIMAKQYHWFFSDNIMPLKKNMNVTAIYGTPQWFMLVKSGYKPLGKPKSYNELINMLRSKEVTAVLDEISSFEYQLSLQSLQPNFFKNKLYQSVNFYAYVSQQYIDRHNQFMNDFNLSITECKE